MEGFQSTLPSPGSLPAADFALTTMQDGTLRIVRNGVPFTDRCWLKSESRLAKREFELLLLRLASGEELYPNRGEGAPRGYTAEPGFHAPFYHWTR